MRVNPESLARASSRHPWRVIVGWAALSVVAFVGAWFFLGGVLNNDIEFTNRPESVRAQELIDTRFETRTNGVGTEYVIVSADDAVVADPGYRSVVERLRDSLAASDLVAEPPVTYYDIAGAAPEQAIGLISDADGDPRTPPDPTEARSTLIPVSIASDTTRTIDELRDLLAEHRTGGYTTQLAGQATMFADFSEIAEEDARKGESIGVAVALIVLVIVFGAILAALVPIAMAVVAITVALGLVSLVGQLVEFNLFVTNMISMIGLAVGIDYSLFIVSRFREERRKGFSKLDAIGAAGATASRAVFFSGMTVVLALLGLFILPTTIFRALASGAIFVTVFSILAAMTLLPAVLALLGDRVDWPYLSRLANLLVLASVLAAGGAVGGGVALAGAPPPAAAAAALATVIASGVVLGRRIRARRGFLARFVRQGGGHDPRGGFWDAITRGVMARPVVFLVAAVALLGGLGVFYFDLNKGSSTSVDTLPDVPAKAAMLTLQREFAGGLTDPVEVVVAGEVGSPAVRAAVEEFRSTVAALRSFAPETVVEPSADGSVLRISAYLKGETQNDEAFDAIRELRTDVVPAVFGDVAGVEVLVGGNTAFFTDFLTVTDTYQWIVLAFVLGLSFLLLTVVFRSIVVPIKAILLNLLSVGAAYGAITLVFQKGVGIGVFNAIGFNFQRTEAIEAWLPLFLFSVLFGLSMDYHVFLLTRIREEYDRTNDNAESVAYGLRTTAGIITGAAIIMVTVFTGFASGRLGPFQQMGFGLAVAVFMDATIVRSVLVPSSMRLLGDVNWYLPRWLSWLPELRVEGREPEREIEVLSAPEPVAAGVVEREDA